MRKPTVTIRRSRAARGFTLIEILIVVTILGILAAIVVPQFSNASHMARENTLKDDLRYLRTQISVYKAQHQDCPPGYPGGDLAASPTEAAFVDQMTRYTDAAGATNGSGTATYRFGPYLQKMPANPLNNKRGVHVVASGALPSPGPGVTDGAGQTAGWIYKPQTLEILANSPGADSDGTAYASY